MQALLKNELRQSRRMMLIWLGITTALCGFAYFEYLSLKNSLDDLTLIVEQFPKIMAIMFGLKGDLNTPVGWYCCIYYWVGILAFFYAAYLGVSCVAREEKFRTSEFLFTKPLSRKNIVDTKALACAVNLLVFALFCGVLNVLTVVLPLGDLSISGAVIRTTIGLYFTQLVLFSIGLLIASVTGSYQSGVRLASLSVLLFYAVSFSLEYLGADFLNFLTPLKYFDVFVVSYHGLNVRYLLLSAAIIAACLRAAGIRWRKRELRG